MVACKSSSIRNYGFGGMLLLELHLLLNKPAPTARALPFMLTTWTFIGPLTWVVIPMTAMCLDVPVVSSRFYMLTTHVLLSKRCDTLLVPLVVTHFCITGKDPHPLHLGVGFSTCSFAYIPLQV